MEQNEELLSTESTETEEIGTEELDKVVGGGGAYGNLSDITSGT